MAEINCPICNRVNDDDAERCWYCQAVLHPAAGGAGAEGDFLDGLRGASDNETAPPGEGSNPDGEQAGEVPDWLARIRQREQMDHGTSDESTPGGGTDAIDWLREISSDVNEQPGTGSSAVEPSGSEGEAADDGEWLQKLNDWQSGNVQPAGEPLKGEKETPHDQKEEAAKTGKDDGIPAEPFAGQASDWLNEFAVDAYQPVEETPEPAPQPAWTPSQWDEPKEEVSEEHLEQDLPAGEGTQENPVEEEPEQIALIEEQTPAEVPSPFEKSHGLIPEEVSETNNAVKPASAEPDWLSDFQTLSPDKDLTSQVLPPQKKESPEKPPFSERDLMSWINQDQRPASEEKTAEVPKEKETAAQPGEADESIAKASIPTWLQALRPEKTKRGAEPGKTSGGRPDARGPLAGINGVLKGDSLHQFYTRPQTYANTLKISPEQENMLQRLQSIAGDARWDATEASAPAPARGTLIRAVIILLILGVVLFSMLTGQEALATSELYPQSVVDSYNIVAGLDQNNPVLIAADFDGSLYGELKWTSSALLGRLLEGGVPVAYLSTTAVGATLLQNNLSDLAGSYPGYDLSRKTVNLGYLAGGTVGLQALAQSPQATVSLDVDFQPAWEIAPFNKVESIGDFGAVIVMTENAETARYWIEQVQPSLGDTPMIVVISAQSSPMLQPYYDSGQIAGYLSGISAAEAFENLGGEPGVGSRYYATFQTSLLLLAIIVFIGGVICLVMRTASTEGSEREGR